MKLGFAWFRPDQWTRLREISADRDELEATFAAWESRAAEMLRSLQAQGMNIEKVIVDVEEILAWCKDRGLPFDASARSGYVAELLRRQDLQ